ncbi:NAD(P)/FAD-dependent oxidoreductase [Aestuariibacter sp. A3R04]|uniref:NAD(P)/FAD-dependent oxidoreductase n=1 Tax=Aestuariibacter sp. A3R04 TaxID=2841571 RepID=UPI001C094C88|nr:tryptophan 7-halogenase [Aestuariibacter sp. A3R04]MBU3020475.1 tryptophan 7-halogenase [Aestuariibacter sp. A3R04]
MNQINTDIIIAGGGLAGMSLALQLLNRNDDLSITIIEKNTFPVHDTTAKVGESTVEIGAHYFTDVLGLDAHFKEKHLRKYGLRLFFGKVDGDYSEYDELGVSELFGIPAYQIERGTLENYLYTLLTEKGVTFFDGAVPAGIDLGDKKQTVLCHHKDGETQITGRWLVDAAGRQALLRNKLNLQTETGHKGNAVFFRVKKRVIIDEWSDNPAWQNRVKEPGKRWLSTNHLMGPGYWVWIIPLASGATSFGIVMDDKALADSNIETFEDTMAWLAKEHPLCAKAIEKAELLDFKVMRDYSYGCKQMFSESGWAMTGEAGAFADPFYSPGSDFIALNNTFITHLIERDMKGQDIRFEAALFHKFYDSFFENTLSIYKDQYGGFGDRKMMSVKLVWDYTYYWGVFALLFFSDAIGDLDIMRKITPNLLKTQKLNKKMQMLLSERAQKRQVLPAKGGFMDQFLVPCLGELNDVLKNPDIDVEQALEKNIAIMQKIVPYFEEMLQDNASANIDDEERAILGDYRLSVLA